jgi:hypothetical protein
MVTSPCRLLTTQKSSGNKSDRPLLSSQPNFIFANLSGLIMQLYMTDLSIITNSQKVAYNVILALKLQLVVYNAFILEYEH